MKKTLEQYCKNENSLYLFVIIAACITFVAIYGVKVLNPLYVDWLLAGGDLTQHYIGWKAFRNADWSFPIGMHHYLTYPTEISIIFTDSIPLFAVFFKLLSPLLPADFQYFGIWGLMCFILQAVLTVRILHRYTSNMTFLIIAGIIADFTPEMIHRMYGHTALAGQWIILLGLELIFNHEKYENSNRALLKRICLIGVLSSSIHIYFVLMSGIVILGLCLFLILRNKKSIVKSIVVLASYLVSSGITVALLGGFSSKMQAGDGGLGVYSFNLNALFNPQGWSCIFQTLPLVGGGQYEGFAYLGAGGILLLFFAFILLVGSEKKTDIYDEKEIIISLIIVALLSVIVSLSPRITLNDKVLFEMHLPGKIIELWSIFRASGRIIWIVDYLIIVGSLCAICKLANKRLAIVTISICLLLQVYDIHEVLTGTHEKFNQTIEFDSTLKTDEFWKCIAENPSIQHVIFTDLSLDLTNMYSFADWATDNHKTINTFYLARSISSEVTENLEQTLEKPSFENLYVFFETNKLKCFEYDLHYYFIDGYYVGCIAPVEGFDEYDITNLSMMWTFGENLYLQEGTGIDIEEGRILYPGGLSYGPYWSVPKGNWIVCINGEGLSETSITVYSQHGALNHDFEVETKDDKLLIRISLQDSVNDLEVLVKNTSGENNITLSDMSIRRGQ